MEFHMQRDISPAPQPRPLLMKSGYAYSVSGGAGGHSTRISHPLGGRFGGAKAGGIAYESYQARDSQSPSTFSIGSEKSTMQHLNERLAHYLETVRKLEEANSKLEIKILEVMENRGPLEERNYEKYNAIIMELRSKILGLIQGNAQLSIHIDNAQLASEDFRAKLECEVGLRQATEADIAQLRKLLDATNVNRLHLETEHEAVTEELILLKKAHKEDMEALRAQRHQAGVQVEVDAPKGRDLATIMEEMRRENERMILKSQQEMKLWHEAQMKQVKVQVQESTEALNQFTSTVNDSRKKYQTMEIELQSELSRKANLESSLHDIEMRTRMEMEKYNQILLSVQTELTKIHNSSQQQTCEYEVLLNIKMKLEAEIAEYRRLLGGDQDFRLEEALEAKKKVQTKVVTITQTLVDGRLVSEAKDVQEVDDKEVVD